jgi:hypothetical protein
MYRGKDGCLEQWPEIFAGLSKFYAQGQVNSERDRMRITCFVPRAFAYSEAYGLVEERRQNQKGLDAGQADAEVYQIRHAGLAIVQGIPDLLEEVFGFPEGRAFPLRDFIVCIDLDVTKAFTAVVNLEGPERHGSENETAVRASLAVRQVSADCLQSGWRGLTLPALRIHSTKETV